jgi:hypothetical protein
MYSVAIACLFHNGAFFLKEWLEFHVLMGVQHFYLGNHRSTDDSKKILEPYIKRGLVDLETITTEYNITKHFEEKIHLPFYQRIIEKCRHTVQWLALIDIDEFITPTQPFEKIGPLLTRIHNNLNLNQKRPHKDVGGIAVNWQMFGTSNTIIPRGHLITETLVRRSPVNWLGNFTVKVIVRPVYVDRVVSPHSVTFKSCYHTYMTNGDRVEGSFSPTLDISTVYLRHYSNGDLQYYDTVKVPYLLTWAPSVIKERRENHNVEEEPRSKRWFISELKKQLHI